MLKIRAGDTFTVIYEELWAGDEVVEPGEIRRRIETAPGTTRSKRDQHTRRRREVTLIQRRRCPASSLYAKGSRQSD
ncbi:MAG: hypothetical protein U9Q81_08980 [Pseudomonadota bacterium]|nr:hypothetical protein [Pseudomonadota bacterium]